MTNRISFICVAFALAGCTTTAPLEPSMDAWRGASEAELRRIWGQPERIYEAGGRRMLAYTTRRELLLPGTGSLYPGSATPETHITFTCTTTFELEAATVVSWSSSGNSCGAGGDARSRRLRSSMADEPSRP